MNTIQSVILSRDDENEAPPSRVLKVSYSEAGEIPSTGEFFPAVLYFAIGDYDERTSEDDFRSSQEQQFSVNFEDFTRALVGLGALDAVIHPS